VTRTTANADALFDEISRTCRRSPNVTTAKMFGGSALKVKNKVFACFYKGKLVLKLPRDRVDDLPREGVAGARSGRAEVCGVAALTSTRACGRLC
jgi:TfoX/Sxy family transcriptional regulator of competence genes